MTEYNNSILELRKKVIEKEFSKMNNMQFKAVTTVKGPVLVLAGAGSGKTTVLVNRIACLIKYGNAYNSEYVSPYVSEEDILAANNYLNGVTENINSESLSVDAAKAWQILAITFTNKAAGELKDRISLKLGSLSEGIWAGTFHSVCAKILRQYGEILCYTNSYTIYDTDDQKKLVKEILKQMGIEEKIFPVRSVLNEISKAKDELLTPEQLKQKSEGDSRLLKIAEIYKEYQNKLLNANAMDFDDLIVNTVCVFKKSPETLSYYQNKFKYIMVDEYQDTNHAQYVLVSMLAEKHKNICVVGDDDQSIYRFRGATIENILSFEDEYKESLVIRLEQNYRSTSNILNAANAVIANNRYRKGKNLWTNSGDGEKITVKTLSDEREEAKFVADSVLDYIQSGGKFKDNAVLYRTNAQSNAIENVFVRSGVSYKVIGGFRFFDRKEIKDIIAYLNVINNKNDDIRLRRIINEPKRGIGETTVNTASAIASGLGVSLYEVFKNCEDFPQLSRSCVKLKSFVNLMENLTEFSESKPVSELMNEVIEKTGYSISLLGLGEEGKDKIENLKELSTTAIQYEKENEDPTLNGFLEEVALVSDLDNYDSETDSVVLMTIHSAKGLEFSNVYLVGMEEGLFPGNQTIYADEREMEEERRLAYVAITRAKKRLYVLNAYTRMIYGQTNRNRVSRFVEEIPKDLCNIESSGISTGFGKVFFKSGSDNYNSNYNNSYNGYKTNKQTIFQQSKQTKSFNNNSNAGKYKAGQKVLHKAFGEGLILSVMPMGNDLLLEVAFETKGTKKIMANFAKMEIL